MKAANEELHKELAEAKRAVESDRLTQLFSQGQGAAPQAPSVLSHASTGMGDVVSYLQARPSCRRDHRAGCRGASVLGHLPRMWRRPTNMRECGLPNRDRTFCRFHVPMVTSVSCAGTQPVPVVRQGCARAASRHELAGPGFGASAHRVGKRLDGGMPTCSTHGVGVPVRKVPAVLRALASWCSSESGSDQPGRAASCCWCGGSMPTAGCGHRCAPVRSGPH